MKLAGVGLTCVRGGRRVFSGVDFSVDACAALLLTGPNGAGKSSLLRIIAGLVRPEAGRLVLDGGDPELSIGEQAHYVGHLDPLKPALTVLENLQFWACFLNGGSGPADPGSANGADVRDTADLSESDALAGALAAVGLADLASLPAGYLSAGQRRRLSLARVLVAPRPVWLLDEPTTALDASSQERLRGLMREHLAGGGILVAATHGPVGLGDAAELRLGGTASTPQTSGSEAGPAPADDGEVATPSSYNRPMTATP
jgi:heme exporter protein A